MSAWLIASCAMNRPYGIFAASITSTCGGSSSSRSRGPSRSAMTTSASARRQPAADRDQVGVAGAAAHQGDAGGAGAVVRGGEGAVAQPLHDRVADGGGVPGVAALRGGGEDGDGDALTAAGGRRPGGGRLRVVAPDAPGAGALGLGGRGVVGGGVGRRDEGVPGVGEVAVLVPAALPADLTGVGHRLDGGGRGRGDQGDVGSGRDEGGQPPLRDLATADDDDAAPVQAQSDGVGGVIVILGHGRACSSCDAECCGRCGGGAAVT